MQKISKLFMQICLHLYGTRRRVDPVIMLMPVYERIKTVELWSNRRRPWPSFSLSNLEFHTFCNHSKTAEHINVILHLHVDKRFKAVEL